MTGKCIADIFESREHPSAVLLCLPRLVFVTEVQSLEAVCAVCSRLPRVHQVVPVQFWV